MSDELNVRIKTTLEADEAKSTQQIEGQLSSISNKLKGKIKVPVEVDTDAGKTIANSIHKATSSAKGSKIVVPVETKIDDQFTRRGLIQDFKRLQAQAGTLKLDTSGYENFFKAGDLQSARKELTVLYKQLRAISAEGRTSLPDLAVTNFGKNVKAATAQTEKLRTQFKSLSGSIPPEVDGTLTTLRTELEKLSQVPIGEATDSDVRKFKELSVSLDEVRNSLTLLKANDKSNKLDIGAGKLQTDIERARQSLSNMKVDWGKAFKDPQIVRQWQNLWDTAGQVKSRAEMTAFNAELSLFKSQIQGAGLATKTFWGQIGDNVKKFSSWFFVGGGVASAVRGVKELFTDVFEINKSFVDLKMATGGTDAEVTKLLDSYTKFGKRIGATTTEIAGAASDWLRQGKTVQETNTLIENSMILSKVGNIESAQSTEYLTTVMKGYKVAVEDTLGVVDMLTAVDLVSATDAGGLAEGMSEVANNANLAGIEMSKLLGYLAVIGESTGQEMSSVGHSLSTVFSRMGNIKLSRLSDYENNGEDLSNVETVLRAQGIELRDSINEFRNFGDVLDETASKWDDFSGVTQRAIASAFAGKNQMEEFLVLMENYAVATQYAATASSSSGTAMAKMETYTSSLEAKQKKLTASTEGLATALIDSGLIGGAYDAGSGVLGFLTQIIETLNVIPTLAAAAGAALSFKNVGRLKLSSC